MTATSLSQLRADLRDAEACYADALRAYFTAYGDRQAADHLAAHSARCRVCGATLDVALVALIDALWFPLNDETRTAEQQRLLARRHLLAAELRLLDR